MGNKNKGGGRKKRKSNEMKKDSSRLASSVDDDIHVDGAKYNELVTWPSIPFFFLLVRIKADNKTGKYIDGLDFNSTNPIAAIFLFLPDSQSAKTTTDNQKIPFSKTQFLLSHSTVNSWIAYHSTIRKEALHFQPNLTNSKSINWQKSLDNQSTT